MADAPFIMDFGMAGSPFYHSGEGGGQHIIIYRARNLITYSGFDSSIKTHQLEFICFAKLLN